ncbi:hypothetical protein Ciccas_013605, partial [Cichlidogyrus casuarinus]
MPTIAKTTKSKNAVQQLTANGDHATSKVDDELNLPIEARLEQQLVLDDNMPVDHEEEIRSESPRRGLKLTLNTIPPYREGTIKLWLTDMEDLLEGNE